MLRLFPPLALRSRPYGRSVSYASRSFYYPATRCRPGDAPLYPFGWRTAIMERGGYSISPSVLMASSRLISLPSDILTSPTGLLALLYGRTSTTTSSSSSIAENLPTEEESIKKREEEDGHPMRSSVRKHRFSVKDASSSLQVRKDSLRRRQKRYPVHGGLCRRMAGVEAGVDLPSSSSSSSAWMRRSAPEREGGGGGGDRSRDPTGRRRSTQKNGEEKEKKKSYSYFQRLCRSDALWLGGIILLLSAIWEAVLSRQDVLQEKFWQLFSITLEVRSSQQPEYGMIVDWMARQSEHSRNVTLRPVLYRDSRVSNKSGGGEAEQEEDTRALFVPGYGRHLFRTPDGVWLWVHRFEDLNKTKRDNLSSALSAGSGGAGVVVGEHDVLRLTFFTRQRSVLSRFLSAVRESWQCHTQQYVSLYTTDYACFWRLLANRPLRPLHTLYLPSSVKAVVEEVREFLQLKDVYRALGVPWRRGYLLEGAPGTGKTSFVMALASTLSLPIYLLPLHTEEMNDESLIRLVSGLPPRCILLVEDVESSLAGGEMIPMKSPLPFPPSSSTSASRTSSGGGGMMPKSTVSMGAFLNALDGVASSEGRVLVMTTNHISSIPNSEAMLRPGRIDKVLHFTPLREEERKEMQAAYEQVLQETKGKLAPPFSSPVVEAEATTSTRTDASVAVDSGYHPSIIAGAPLLLPSDLSSCNVPPPTSTSSLPSSTLSSTSALSPAEYQLALLNRFLSTVVRQDDEDKKRTTK